MRLAVVSLGHNMAGVTLGIVAAVTIGPCCRGDNRVLVTLGLRAVVTLGPLGH